MKRVVHTCKNTNFKDWMAMANAEMLKMGTNPDDISALRHKHAWEGGDTPWGWADHVTRSLRTEKQRIFMRQFNPDH